MTWSCDQGHDTPRQSPTLSFLSSDYFQGHGHGNPYQTLHLLGYQWLEVVEKMDDWWLQGWNLTHLHMTQPLSHSIDPQESALRGLIADQSHHHQEGGHQHHW